MNAVFEKLCRRTGGYSLPWLIALSNGVTTLRYINDVASVSYDGNTYTASTFNYTPDAESSGFVGGGTLNIAAADANTAGIIALVHASTSVSLSVVGVLMESGTITPIKNFNHSRGSVTLNGRTAAFTFERDERLDMTFPALIFSHYNMRGAT